MNLDKYGLPMQADGDRNDQLQRCAMIYIAENLSGVYYTGLGLGCHYALLALL